MKTKFAFTLAETLITLVIVGTVAAVTIPALISKYTERANASRFKKVYSTFLQCNYKAINANGPINTWEFKDCDEFITKYLKPYLNIAKMCKPYPSRECQMKYKSLNGKYVDYSVQPKFVLNDGTVVMVHAYGTKSKAQCPAQTFVCGGAYVYVDTNGDKGPNEEGKDVVYMEYYIHSNSFVIPNSFKSLLVNQ